MASQISDPPLKQIDDLPELDFQSAAYLSAPFATLADWASRWKIARSARGVELLDYDLCRDAIVARDLGTGHPRLMQEIGLPESAALEFKKNAIGFHNRGERRRALRLPMNRLFAPARIEKYRQKRCAMWCKAWSRESRRASRSI